MNGPEILHLIRHDLTTSDRTMDDSEILSNSIANSLA